MTYFKFILFLILNFSFIYATTHKDIRDESISQWRLVESNNTTSVKKDRKSRVIEFKGAGTKQIYEFYTSENKEGHEYWVSWDMKFSEDFVIILQIQSNLGKHYLIYTPGTLNSYMQYGLGRGTTNGRWRTFRRNIQKDIAYFDNRVKIVSLKRFVVKGNGMISNIKTILGSPRGSLCNRIKKSRPGENLTPGEGAAFKSRPPLDVKPPLEKKKKNRKIFKAPKSSSPVIKMKGKKVVKLKLGEPYVEKGVSAYDKEDGKVDVVTMENIYINEVGRYMILYMATDSDGNIAIDKRYVDVGDVENKKKKATVKKHKNKEVPKAEDEEAENEEEPELEEGYEDFSEEDIEMSKKAAEMRLWERKLALREKELKEKREKKSNKDWKKHL